MILSELAGLKPADAGFRHFIAEPRFDLIPTLDAEIPTNVGTIGIRRERTEDDRCEVYISKPETAACTFCAPEDWTVKTVAADGTVITDGNMAKGKVLQVTVVRY